MRIYFSILCLCFLAVFTTCRKDNAIAAKYKTKHVVLIVVDGARYCDTWYDSTYDRIPFRAGVMRTLGVCDTNFINNGFTWTSSGHDAMCTGNYEPLDNGGHELPGYASFFQYYRKATGAPMEKTWVITSKDKLFVLANCKDASMQSLYTPLYDCGVNGPFTGYREDSITYQHVIDKLQSYHPDLLLVNFREPDWSGHQGNWTNYLSGIRNTDQYIRLIWYALQNDPYYAGTTTLMVTNDHGRHSTGHLDGFVSHGDQCWGCRHVEFDAIGPDFRSNTILPYAYELKDIPNTIGELMGFTVPTSQGKVMKELFR